ncbi:MAG: glycosyltransferase family 2 protein [Lachnospiraceae bacterium]|nr:glycosyltransferase family 2 protein [Lachnospiraceae bacterium]
MAEVSIIVPVYNAEKTIRRCIESILNQEYTDFELILCDDGSRDASGKICDEYQRNDARIRVLHKENTGVSDTRNQGIQMAQGKYIQFLDADDWITVDATKLLVRTMKELDCDLVISDFYRVVGERLSHKGDIDTEGVLTPEEFAEFMMRNPADFYYGVLWNKLYKREIMEKHQLRMDKSMDWCEDFLFNLEYLLHVQRIAALQVPIYYYVKTEGSLVTQGMSISKTIKMKISVFEYYNAFYKHIYEEEDYEKRRLSVCRFLFDTATDGFVMPSFLGGSKKLGEERTGSYVYENLPNNIFSFHYQRRKLLEQYLEAIALRYDLELEDITLLTYIPKCSVFISKQELMDYTGYSARLVSRILQRLSVKKVIELITVKKKMKIHIMEDYLSLYNELEYLQKDYMQVCFQGFTEEEKEACRRLIERTSENIKRILVVK